jgi:hypothetical protein
MFRTVPSSSRCVLARLVVLAVGACRRGDDAVGVEIRHLVSASKPAAALERGGPDRGGDNKMLCCSLLLFSVPSVPLW